MANINIEVLAEMVYNTWEDIYNKHLSWEEVWNEYASWEELYNSGEGHTLTINDFTQFLIEKVFNDEINLTDLLSLHIQKENIENLAITDDITRQILKNIEENLTIYDTIIFAIEKFIDNEILTIDDIVSKHVQKFPVENLTVEDKIEKKKRYLAPQCFFDILDRNEEKIGICTSAFDFIIKQSINGEFNCSFKIPANSREIKDNLFQMHYHIKITEANNQKFYITDITTNRDENNKLIYEIKANHIFFKLNNYLYKDDDVVLNYKPNTTASTILNILLTNTPFTLLQCDITEIRDFYIERGSIRENILKVINEFGGELELDNYTIKLKNNIGVDNGIQVRYGKNLKYLKRELIEDNMVTKLYVFGRSGLTLNAVNNNLDYLLSANHSIYNITKFIAFNEIEDINMLFEEGVKYLNKHENPQLVLEVGMAELQKYSGFVYPDSYSIGDTIRLIDEELGIDTTARIKEYTFYPFQQTLSSIVISDYSNKSTDYFTKFNKTTTTVNRVILDNSGSIDVHFFKGIISPENVPNSIINANIITEGTLTNIPYTQGSITDSIFSNNTLQNNTIQNGYTLTNNGTITNGIITNTTLQDNTLSGTLNINTTGKIVNEDITIQSGQIQVGSNITIKNNEISLGNGSLVVGSGGNLTVNSYAIVDQYLRIKGSIKFDYDDPLASKTYIEDGKIRIGTDSNIDKGIFFLNTNNKSQLDINEINVNSLKPDFVRMMDTNSSIRFADTEANSLTLIKNGSIRVGDCTITSNSLTTSSLIVDTITTSGNINSGGQVIPANYTNFNNLFVRKDALGVTLTYSGTTLNVNTIAPLYVNGAGLAVGYSIPDGLYVNNNSQLAVKIGRGLKFV